MENLEKEVIEEKPDHQVPQAHQDELENKAQLDQQDQKAQLDFPVLLDYLVYVDREGHQVQPDQLGRVEDQDQLDPLEPLVNLERKERKVLQVLHQY